MITVRYSIAKIARNSNFNRYLTFFVFTILFDQFSKYLFFKNIIRKLIKFFLIFCIQNKQKFSAKKLFHLKANLLEPAHVKKIVNFVKSDF